MKKVCRKCKEEKELTEFDKKGKSVKGVQMYRLDCKLCRKEIVNECQKKYYENNKEERQKYNREYAREYTKNNIDKCRERQKDYRENNKDKIKEFHKKYYENNKDRIKEYHKKYYMEKQKQKTLNNNQEDQQGIN